MLQRWRNTLRRMQFVPREEKCVSRCWIARPDGLCAMTSCLTERIKEAHFDAAHYLKHLAPCDRLHGHTYVLNDLELTGTLEENVIVDFKEIKRVLDQYDH